MSTTRLRHVSIARFAFFHLLKKHYGTGYSLSKIGKILNRSHALVLHGLRKIRELQEIGDRVYVTLIKDSEAKFEELINLEDFHSKNGSIS